MEEFKHAEILEKDYESLLNLLKTSTFSEKYPLYQVSKRGITYIIKKVTNLKEDKDSFLVFEGPIETTINFNNSKKQEKLILYSSLDLVNYCTKNNMNIYNFSIEKDYKFNKKYLVYLSSYIKKYSLSLLYIEEKQLDFQPKNDILESKDVYKMSELSIYYKDYFCTNIDPNMELYFTNNEASNSLEINLNLLLYDPDDSIKKFKFTGPVSIGKTAFLLYYCHLSNDAFYINLKLLKTIDDIKKAYLIIKEEFSRSKDFEAIQKIIDRCYNQELEPIEGLFEIIDYFTTSSNNVLLAFDHYKEKYLNLKVKTKLANLKENIKIVYCSSINDKSMHDECAKTWNRYKRNLEILDNENQDYYFYYSSLYEENNKKKKSKNIIDKFNGIYRYTKYFNTERSGEESIKEVSEKVIEKIKDFSSSRNCTFDLILTNIKNIVNRKHEIEKLNNIVEYCPLKFIVVKFLEDNFFILKYRFPFLKYIVETKLTESQIKEFFSKKKYLKTSNELIKGDYFESSVKIGLKKSIKLPVKFDKEIILDEIVTMEKQVEINYESDEESDIENEEEEKEDDNEQEEQYKEEDIEKKKDEEIKEDNENKKDNDNFNKSEIKEKIISSDCKQEKDVKKETEFKDNSSFIKLLLKKFSINYTENEINVKKNEISLEGYRIREIMRLIKSKETIPQENMKFKGNENINIDQKKKKGRTLDYAFLYGPQFDKTFIGFQMKCYFKGTKSINNKFINKNKIKESCQKILFNSMTFFNCKITNWYYYLIFYINDDSINCNVNQDIIDKGKDKVEILFYDPLKKIFKDSNKNEIKILSLSYNANLDNYMFNIKTFLPNINDFSENLLEIQKLNREKTENSFKKDFDFLQKETIDDILNVIKNIMEIKSGIIRLYTRANSIFYIKLPPLANYIILHKKKNKIGFIGVKSICLKGKIEDVKYYDIKEGKEIKNFYEVIDADFPYVYVLTKTRNYNEVKANWENESEEGVKLLNLMKKLKLK